MTIFSRRGLLACLPPLACTLVAGCAPGFSNGGKPDPDETLVVGRNIPYAPGSEHDFDIYRDPKLAGTLPVLVFFYAGDWRTTDSDQFLAAAAALVRAGMIVAIPNQRLYPTAATPDFRLEAARAVAAIARAAPSWGGDPSKVFVFGYSAAAYLALALALDPNFLAQAGARSVTIAGAIAISTDASVLTSDADVQSAFAGAAPPPRPASGPPPFLVEAVGNTSDAPRSIAALADRLRADGGSANVTPYPPAPRLQLLAGFAPAAGGITARLGEVAAFVTAQAVAT